MWIQLKSVIMNTIKDMVAANKERRKGSRTNPGKTATTATSETVKAAEEENPDIVVTPTVVIPEVTEEIKEQVEKELQDEGYEEVTEEQIQQYLDSNTRIKYVNHGSRGAFIDYEDRKIRMTTMFPAWTLPVKFTSSAISIKKLPCFRLTTGRFTKCIMWTVSDRRKLRKNSAKRKVTSQNG